METMRVHRVGTITAGLSMVIFGGMYLLHMFLPRVSYDLIFRLWPVILIGLGVELLISNAVKERLIYDKAAVFLVFIVMLFAMGMAGADLALQMLETTGL